MDTEKKSGFVGCLGNLLAWLAYYLGITTRSPKQRQKEKDQLKFIEKADSDIDEL